MKSINIWIGILITILALVLVPISTTTATSSPTLTPTPAPARQPLESPDDAEINAAYGTIEARFNGTNDQLIILIGENHASYKVQENVARIAEQLLSEYDVRLLLIEGFGEAIDTGFIDAIPDTAIRREVAWAFLMTHEISGIEYAALVSGPEVETIGIENMDLWQQSHEAGDDEPDVDDPAVQQAWSALVDQIIALIDQLDYTTELDKMVNDFVDDEIGLSEFYDYLLETAAEESVSSTALETAYIELQKSLSPVLKFASDREPFMLDNSLSAMNQYDVNVAIMLVGHAHFLGVGEEGGLSQLMQDRGISYIYILPDGTEDETTDEENQYYEDQLAEKMSAFEAWLNSLFKPKPTLSRPNRQAEIEVVGKVAFLESEAQKGASWDEFSNNYADWLSGGRVHVQNRFDEAGDFSIYAARAMGENRNETFVLAVSASGDQPQISHQDDLIADWTVGERRIIAIKGRSADILIGRGIVAKESEAGKTFAYGGVQK